MKTPLWETSAGALAAFLNAATQGHFADLYTLTTPGGTVVRWTSDDVASIVNGVTYALGPAIKMPKSSVSVGIDVKTLSIEFSADSSVLVGSIPLMQFVAAGGFDNCKVQRDRVFSAGPGAAWVGSVNMFVGTESDTLCSRYSATMTVNSDTQLFNVMVPRNVYQPGCSNTLFDGACQASRASFSASVTATSATDSTLTVFNTGSGAAANYYALGFMLGLTGANAGIRRTVKAFSGGVFTAMNAWPFPVTIGDTFTAFAGCDKTQATCTTKFSNVIHFRGQPYVPAPETVL